MNNERHSTFKIFTALTGRDHWFTRGLLTVATTALMSAFLGSIALARKLDNTVLQIESSTPTQVQDANTQATPAQTQPQTSSVPTTQPQITQPADSAFTLPAGTRLPLGLVRPLWYKSTKPGTDVYLQITFPVTVGSQMLVPPGTYVQGVIEKVLRHDRARGVLEFEMRSANLIFSNGYTAAISGIVTVAKTSARLLPPQSAGTGQAVPAMAAVGGVTAPPLPMPSLGNGPRNALIGLGVAAAVGTTALVLLAGHNDFEMEVGTPLAIVLPAPVPLNASQVTAAVHQYDQQIASAPPQIVQPPKKPKICYDLGTPGTPDTVIPGSPGTPDTVIPGINGAPPTVIPGSPRTPDTVIPGTPGTLGRSYPCP